MSNTQLITTTTTTTEAEDPSSLGSLLNHRRIEFHLARKQQQPLSSISSDFKLHTLNPSSSPNIVNNTNNSNNNTSLQNQPNNQKKHDLFDATFVDPDLSFRISFPRIGAGLQNLGNTCFLNSVLQCLTYTEPLVGYLQTGKHQNSCHVAGFCALCAMQKHVSRALQSTGRIVAPKDLVSNLRCISRSFRNARQEDAHEYMINLLESMHKCCLPSGVPAQSPGAYEKSLVHKIFGGRLRSQVKCQQCNHCSNTFDPFLDLSLEIVKADTVHKALSNYTAIEHLDGGERQYKCERCKQKVRALKQLTIYKAPYILSIHLKRFRAHLGGQKIDKKVLFGSALDLKPFVTGPYEGDLKYTLYGVLVHAGWSTHSGHYYCYVRTSSGLWYSLDDNRVSSVSEKTVLEQKAYMLFYVRDRKNVPRKQAMDIVQKESLIATMRKASSSGSVPGIKVFQNGCTGNPSEKVSSGLPPKNVVSSITCANAASEKISPSLPAKNAATTVTCASAASTVTCASEASTITCAKESIQKAVVAPSSELPVSTSLKSSVTVASSSSHKDVVDQVSLGRESGGENSSATANGVKKTSQIEIALDSKANGPQTSIDKSTKPLENCPSEPTLQEGCEPETCKEGVPTPMSDVDSVLVKSRCQSSSSNGSVPSKSSKSAVRRRLKMVVGMRLSSKMLYGASLSVKIKKKGKKTKRRVEKILPQQSVGEGLVSIDMGPATSEKKSEDLNVGKLSRESASASSVDNHVDVGASCSSQLQSGVTTDFSGVLEETAVGCWEGVEPPPKIKGSNGPRTSNIGYVPDEWDEEYDRGKRKKVRGPRHEFGGPNPFQEIAMAKTKRARQN